MAGLLDLVDQAAVVAGLTPYLYLVVLHPPLDKAILAATGVPKPLIQVAVAVALRLLA